MGFYRIQRGHILPENLHGKVVRGCCHMMLLTPIDFYVGSNDFLFLFFIIFFLMWSNDFNYVMILSTEQQQSHIDKIKIFYIRAISLAVLVYI